MKILVFLLTLGLSLFSCSPPPLGEDHLKSYLGAKAEYESGNFKNAAASLDVLLKDRPDFFQAKFLRAKAWFFYDDLKKSEDDLTSLLKDHPEHSQAEFWLALVEVRTNRLESAEKRIDNLLSHDPQDYRLLYERGILYLKRNDLKNALDFFNQATLAEADLAKPHMEAGRIFYGLGDTPKAVAQLDRAKVLLDEHTPLAASIDALMAEIQKPKDAKK